MMENRLIMILLMSALLAVSCVEASLTDDGPDVPEVVRPQAVISVRNMPEGLESVRFVADAGDDVKCFDIEVPADGGGVETVEFSGTVEKSWTIGYVVRFPDEESLIRTMAVAGPVGHGDVVSIVLDLCSDARVGVLTCSNGSGYRKSEEFVNVGEGGDRYEAGNPRYDVYVHAKGHFCESLSARRALVSNGKYNQSIWNDWNNIRKLRDTMSYVNFVAPFDSPEEMIVKRRDDAISFVDIRPETSVSDSRTIGGHIVRFSFGGGAIMPKLSVEFDGDRYHNLFVYGSRPDQDRDALKSDPKTVFYGRGNHSPGLIVLRDGQTLYVDEGAVVSGCVQIEGSDISIRGRGVITGASLPHFGNIYAEGSKLVITTGQEKHRNITVEGVTFVDSPNWTLCLSDVDGLKIKDVNIITHINNADGIDLQNCNDAEVSGCFIRTYDDNVSWKITTQYGGCLGDCYNITMSDCLLWGDHARCVMVGPESGQQGHVERSIHDCKFKDCVILESFGTALAVRQEKTDGNSPMPIRNIVFENIRMSDVLSSCLPFEVCQYADMNPVCEMSGIHFRNITVTTKSKSKQSFVKDNGNTMSDIVFENVIINGERLSGPGSLMQVSGSVTPVFR